MYPSFRFGEQWQEEREDGDSVTGMPLDEKLHRMMEWLIRKSRAKSNVMLYLIMYDIENNKVRNHVAKYLIRKGCLRIQKSVYLAKSSVAVMKDISTTLKEINEIYDNKDSILVLPVPEEKFNNIRVIGKNIEFEIVTRETKVLFF